MSFIRKTTKFKNGYQITKYKFKKLTLYRKKVKVSFVENNSEALSVNEVIYKRNRNFHPLNLAFSKDSHASKRLNLVADTIDEIHLFGGTGTAIILATLFCAKNNLPLRIITRYTAVSEDSYWKFVKLMQLPHLKNVEFYSDYDRDDVGHSTKYLAIHKEDFFLAAAWWNAQALVNSGIQKFQCLIQDDESLFYPSGNLRWFCTQIFNNKNIKFIINSKYLFDYFKKYFPNIYENGTYFHPAFPGYLYNQTKNKKDKHKLFFYARPGCERNLYEPGLLVLDKSLKEGVIDTKLWDIYFAGALTDDIIFSNGYKPQFLEKMSWGDYAKFISSVDLTFGLIYTPHPAYVNLDTLASGGIAVTNSYATKCISNCSENFIISDNSLDGLVNGLKQGIKLSLDTYQRQKNFEQQSIPDDWNDALSDCFKFMELHINHCLLKGQIDV